ncbi:MAG: extracellular solute-binding protein [Ruminococcus sp.]|nr:extracellular solute-binding protein [Ruminococcus sp.]MCM1380405.1 extracellular solute-binding protein [Muribaculaceae bacterium]MCM1478059.1 extracellular solute-binding protein [Muribaculaceae bacterium]
MSRKSCFMRFLSAAIAVSTCLTAVPAFPAIAEENPPAAETQETEQTSAFVRQKTYSDYYDEIQDVPRPDKEAALVYSGCSDDAEVEIGSYEGKENVLIWSNEVGTVDFTVDVPEAGAYQMEVSYFPIADSSVTEMSVLIDGVSPYDTATRVEMNHIWKSDGDITPDSKDNEVRPPQIQAPRWVTNTFYDTDGLFNEPLYFYFETAGEHTVSLESERASVAIEYIKLCNQKGYASYTKPSESELAANSGAAAIKLQGEKYAYTNSQSLFPTYDRGSYLTEPSHPSKQRYNTVGDGTWDTVGQRITWEMYVETAGYYKVGIKARQNELRGLYTNRRLYIDGEVPNEEMSQIKFQYDDDWIMVTPEDENGDPVYVYLEPGKHELALEVIPGEIGDSMRRLDSIVYTANQYYMQILMITGPSPDKYTDYYVHKEIPELVDTFNILAIQLLEEEKNIEELAGQQGTEAAALERLATVLQRGADKPHKIPDMISNSSIKDNVASVSSWMRQYRNQPLEVDFIELVPADQDFTPVKSNFFKSLSFGFKGFINSFFEDYTVLSDTTKDSINVWVGLGRDQANVIKQLVDAEYNTTHSTQVSINLVQGGIMEAVLAGKGPDSSLFVGGEFPVNLAVRDLVVPLNDLDGFNEVKSRFQENAMVNYTYDGNVYAIPINQSFPMMFYRKDMLAEIGITEPPETWDELIDMLPAIQRKYMQPGLILPGVAAATNGAGVSVSPATEAGHTFALLMLQSGNSYYNDEQTATKFDTQAAVDAFATWTDFYNIYKFDQTYDPFTRFRTGEAPIVIQSYCSFYNQLNVAAPEIKGLWDFTSVPGTLQADGTVSHASNSNGSGAIILESCKNKDGAWDFIKWFTSTDVMVEYGQNVEGVMGPLGRFDCANVEALQQLNWSKKDMQKILNQMNELEEIPIVPSAYVVTRSIMNAFRSVVNDKENARETLRWYNIDINREITRKRENLGLDDEN